MEVLVVAEMQLGKLKPSNGAAIRFAQDLAAQTGGSFSIVLLGHELGQAVADTNRYGARSLFVVDSPRFAHYLAHTLAGAVVSLVKERGFDTIVGGEATTARDFLPRVAGALEAGMCRGVCAVQEVDGAICFQRPVFSGMALRVERLHSAIRVLTVDPTVIGDPAEGPAGEVIDYDPPSADSDDVRFVELRRAESSRPDLTVAERVIGAGRGVKTSEYLEEMGKLADKLGAALGATRAVVDAGWMPNEFQVGQTGKSIAPQLYIAVGISGAVQHAAGIRGAKTIVAINKDPEAPIFKTADIGLVANLFDVVPYLLEEL